MTSNFSFQIILRQAKFLKLGYDAIYSVSIEKDWKDFPGGPVVKIPCSQCRGPKFNP